MAAVKFCNFHGDDTRISGACWKCQEIPLLCPYTIGHAVFILTFLQSLAGEPTKWQHIEGASLIGEHQHQRSHVSGCAQIEAGITLAADQVRIARLIARHLREDSAGLKPVVSCAVNLAAALSFGTS